MLVLPNKTRYKKMKKSKKVLETKVAKLKANNPLTSKITSEADAIQTFFFQVLEGSFKDFDKGAVVAEIIEDGVYAIAYSTGDEEGMVNMCVIGDHVMDHAIPADVVEKVVSKFFELRKYNIK